LMEVFVNYQDGFVEELRPAGKVLNNYLDELNIVLPRGFHTEVNLEAIKWLKDIADCLKSGFVITIDYGYTSSELYNDRRINGTLLCYHRHTINNHPLSNIGEQDITAHINFSALSHWGLKYGLHISGLISQAGFFIGNGYEDYLGCLLSQRENNYPAFKQYAYLKHALLVDMGQKYRVLIQHKGVPHTTLKCFESRNETSVNYLM